ncbi:MAG: SMC family ATPase, partial [Clostridiales bacterium]|nr:SMC family ATPase [Clostridiales bacterium]
MKIRQLRLQNVKSYLDETILFNNGVNFISGVNGAGKTTIIEGIGYAVFNKKPDSINEFIRYGAKTGAITVELEANDGRRYRLARKFGNVNSWLVFDLETEMEVDLHGVADVVPFLKEIFGVEPEQDLSRLFEDIIGVSQGSFTTPFLESAAGRRNNFDRIFRVESYKEANRKTLGTVRRLEELVNALGISRAEKEGGIKEYDETALKVQELIPVLEKLEMELSGKKAERAAAEKSREALQIREKELSGLSGELQVKEERIKSLGETLVRLQEELKTAQAAGAELIKAESGYNAYLALKQGQELLETQRKERDKLKETLAYYENKISEFSAAIETENVAVEAEKADIKAAGEAADKAVAAAGLEHAKVGQEMKQLQGTRDLLEKLRQETTAFEDAGNGLDRLNIKLAADLEKWGRLETEIAATEAFISGEAAINQGMEQLRQLEEARKTVSLEIAA